MPLLSVFFGFPNFKGNRKKGYLFTGWYPELVFISVVFYNSTNLAVFILNSSVLKIYFVKLSFENQSRDLSQPARQTEPAI